VDWRELFSFDITPILTPGKHVLAVRAYNSFFYAGVILKLEVHLTDGGIVSVRSDPAWRVVPNSAKGWETRTTAMDTWLPATIKARMGESPWSPWPVNVVGMPTLQRVHLAFWQTVWFQITVLTLFWLLILFSLRLMAQLALHRTERMLLQQERTRIAREIHDDIGAKMTQLVLHGEVAQRDLPDGSTTQLQLAEICDESRSVLAAMDEILWAVNPQRDTLRDFASYVCKYAEEFLKLTPIQCLFEVSPEMPAVPFNMALRRSLLMAIKETLNNTIKYSEATELRIWIRWENEVLNVVVHDNGKGFDPRTVNPERHGMTNMKQRMSELGGTCHVDSAPGKRCRIEFSIPLKRPRKNPWNRFSRDEPILSVGGSGSHPLSPPAPKP
jgi:signal transduction histidine kinase